MSGLLLSFETFLKSDKQEDHAVYNDELTELTSCVSLINKSVPYGVLNKRYAKYLVKSLPITWFDSIVADGVNATIGFVLTIEEPKLGIK